LKLARKFELDKKIVKDLIYGCIKELGQNKEFYYHSKFGGHYDYLTEKGEEACLAIFKDFVEKVLAAEEHEYQERKKRDTFNSLKNSE